MAKDQIRQRNCLTKSWPKEMQGFGDRAVMIRKILDRFHKEDVATRRYLRRYLDEEWAKLQSTYENLRDEFASRNLN